MSVNIINKPEEEYPFIITITQCWDKSTIYKCKEVPVENSNYLKLVSSDDEVAILHTSTEGAGWYTNNEKFGERLVKDSKIIRYAFEKNYSNLSYKKFMKEIIGFKKVPDNSDWAELTLTFIKQGLQYEIIETCSYGPEAEEVHILDNIWKA